MIKKLLLAGFIIASLCFISIPALAKDMPSLQARYIKAAAADMVSSVGQWEALLQDIQYKSIRDEFITEELVRKNLMQSLLARFRDTHTLEDIYALQSHTALMNDTEAANMLLYTLDALTDMNKITQKPDYIIQAQLIFHRIQQHLGLIEDISTRESFTSRLVHIATKRDDKKLVFNETVIPQLHQWIFELSDMTLRMQAINEVRSIKNLPLAPAPYDTIYKALASSDSEKALLELYDTNWQQGKFTLALQALLALETQTLQQEKLKSFYLQLYDDSQLSRARRVAYYLLDPFVVKTKPQITSSHNTAQQKTFDSVMSRYRAQLKKDELTEVMQAIANTKDTAMQSKLLREVARQQAANKDAYGLLKNTEKAYHTRLANIIKRAAPQVTYSDDIIHVTPLTESTMGQKMPAFSLSDSEISALAPTRYADISVTPYNVLEAHNDMLSAFAPDFLQNLQATSAPVIIMVQAGIVDIPTLYDNLRYEPHGCLKQKKQSYILHCPLVIASNAGLIIDDSIDKLQLSAKKGAYIFTSGALSIAHTTVEGTEAVKDAAFRPFIYASSSSDVTITDTTIINLGYDHSYATGLTLSGQRSIVITSSLFHHMSQAIHIINAGKVFIKDNYIHNSVQNGIIITETDNSALVYNTVTSNGRNGLSLTSLNDSVIVGNIVYNNQQAAISANKVGSLQLALNYMAHNYLGLSLQHSQCAMVGSNTIAHNEATAIALDATYNIALYGNNIYKNGIAVNSSTDDKTVSTATLAYNTIKDNNKAFTLNGMDAASFAHNVIDQSQAITIKDSSLLAEKMKELVANPRPVTLGKKCIAIDKLVTMQNCPYRQQTLFGEDGQDHLVKHRQCDTLPGNPL